MNCRQTKKYSRSPYPALPELRAQAEAHAQQCHACRVDIALEQLTVALVKSLKEDLSATPYAEQRLVYRTMERIKEIKERRAATWITAVVHLRAWVFGFAAAALLLLALSTLQALGTNKQSVPEEELALDAALAPGEDLDYVPR